MKELSESLTFEFLSWLTLYVKNEYGIDIIIVSFSIRPTSLVTSVVVRAAIEDYSSLGKLSLVTSDGSSYWARLKIHDVIELSEPFYIDAIWLIIVDQFRNTKSILEMTSD